MKKLFLGVLIAASFIFTSCGVQFGLVYGVQLSGNGDGNFKVDFPQGSYAMDGKATLVLNVGDTIPFNNAKVTTKNEVLESAKWQYVQAMERVNDSIATQFNAFAGEGTYDLWVKGFVKEMGTGLIFEIDRHITNKTPLLKNTSGEEFCPYIK